MALDWTWSGMKFFKCSHQDQARDENSFRSEMKRKKCCPIKELGGRAAGVLRTRLLVCFFFEFLAAYVRFFRFKTISFL